MPDLPLVHPGRHGVFTGREARAAGWSQAALHWALRTGRIVRLERDVYGPPVDGVGAEAARARFAAASVAGVLAVRPAVGSHRSSAVLAGLPVWTVPARACITVPPRYTGDARHSHLHRATLALADVHHATVHRTAAARTVVDVAREAGIEEAVVIGDAALARRLTDLDRICRVVEDCAGWPGRRFGRQVPFLLDARSESPLESVSRLRLAAGGLPAPEPQVEICDRDGHRIGWVDFYWDEYGVVGEVDGKVKFRDDPVETAWRQLTRQQLLEETGLYVIRWGRADLDGMPRLASRLQSAFARGLRRPAADRRWVATTTDRFAPRTWVIGA